MPRDDDRREKTVQCSFCHKKQEQVDKLIAGQGVYICNECVELCQSIIEEDTPHRRKTSVVDNVMPTLPKPHEIKARLDEYVIGQDGAKVALSVAVYNHYKRIFMGKTSDSRFKSSILLLGRPASAKPYLPKLSRQYSTYRLPLPTRQPDGSRLCRRGYRNILLSIIRPPIDIEKRGLFMSMKSTKTHKSEIPRSPEMSAARAFSSFIEDFGGYGFECPPGASTRAEFIRLTPPIFCLLRRRVRRTKK